MSESLKSIHVRLSSDAHRALSAIADIEEKDNAEMARLIRVQLARAEVPGAAQGLYAIEEMETQP